MIFNDKDIKPSGYVDVWDLGPERPSAPDAPPEPKKTGRSVDDAVAAQQYEDAMADYKAALRRYAVEKREYDEHRIKVGGAIRIEQWPTDAERIATEFPGRYVKDLPPGIKPGKAHEEAVEMAAKRDEERVRIKERDPHMGKPQGAGA